MKWLGQRSLSDAQVRLTFTRRAFVLGAAQWGLGVSYVAPRRHGISDIGHVAYVAYVPHVVYGWSMVNMKPVKP